MFKVTEGKGIPLGISFIDKNTINFAVFSRNASSITLALYEDANDDTAFFIYNYDKNINKTGDIWHCCLSNIDKNYYYGYFLDGPNNKIHSYDKAKLILDPYSKYTHINKDGLSNHSLYSNKHFINSQKFAPKGILHNTTIYNGEKLKKFDLSEQIIYELHVKGFTKLDKTIKYPGTFKALTEKIPYLKDLGVTAIELMPINIFDSFKIIRHNKNNQPLRNYWGYDSINFLSIHYDYACSKDPIKAVDEFKKMVDELHKNNIYVILDVVFNHTPEGNEYGPIFSYKGLDNSIYYMLNGNGTYMNFSGCGNTLNCNHPVLRDLILEALTYWVIYMGVDGFRFDLASIMSRDSYGNIIKNPPIIERITEHPILRDCFIIAEAWDAAGAYEVGSFGSNRWAEWNGKYRDVVRGFIKADFGSHSKFCDAIIGSPSVYFSKQADKSINFITCHDGFSLNDLVSYNEKHNIDNGEDNKDGENNNKSWNCGVEGISNDAEIVKLRKKQMKNFMLTLLVSMGVPMIKAGDEFCHSQNGNNNPYCQDNEISWLNWENLSTNADFFRFTRLMISFRKENQALRRKHYYENNQDNLLPEYCDISWYSKEGKKPNWTAETYDFGILIKGWIDKEPRASYYNDDIFIIFNTHWDTKEYKLPKVYKRTWHIFADTSKESPDDILENPSKLENQDMYTVQARSIAIILGKYKGKKKDNLSTI